MDPERWGTMTPTSGWMKMTRVQVDRYEELDLAGHAESNVVGKKRYRSIDAVVAG